MKKKEARYIIDNLIIYERTYKNKINKQLCIKCKSTFIMFNRNCPVCKLINKAYKKLK